jgi:endoglucanase
VTRRDVLVAVVLGGLVVVALSLLWRGRGAPDAGGDEPAAPASTEPPAGPSEPEPEPVGPEGASGAEQAAHDSAFAFLDAYVGPDGRVSRPDQGDDTVSEGQAYALLLAAAVDDHARFDRVWGWTSANLLRADGLLAWHWDDGGIVDDDPATDADLDAARALLVAGERWTRPDLTAAGQALGAAVSTHELGAAPSGPVLLAGPWAAGPPTVVNPSYGSPRAYAELLGASVAGPWDELAVAERARLEDLGVGAGQLPPDWTHLDPTTGTLAPVGPPATPDAPAESSYDAGRVPVRLAESCDEADRALAASLRSPLGDGAHTRMALDGSSVAEGEHPLGLVARAAAADADGDDAAAGRLLEEAAELEQQQPGYYGSAWVALGRVMLTTDLLGPC